MPLSDKHIEEIAEYLECGQICFYHRPTETIEHYPDLDDLYFEPEQWQETIDNIEADMDNFKRFEKMDSSQGFRVMEDFANSLTDTEFQNMLFEVLLKRNPFRNFKMVIENSIYRQPWFDFKRQMNISWVREQMS